MISTSNVTLRVGKKALFEDVNIKFTEGNCRVFDSYPLEKSHTESLETA